MRRDLTRGCSSCRLRFSAALLCCPACGRKALDAPEAIGRVEIPPRAAWLAKWAIVLALVPALGLLVKVMLGATPDMFSMRFGALDVLTGIAGLFCAFLGMGIVLAIPVGLWVGIVALVRWVLGRHVDRRESKLRVALDRASRREEHAKDSPALAPFRAIAELHARLFPENRPHRGWFVLVGALLLLEGLAEVFSRSRMLDFSNPLGFVASLGTLLFFNAVFLVLGNTFIRPLWGVLGKVLEYFRAPPTLFGFQRHSRLINDELIARWTKGREEVVGRAEPLTDAERAALSGHGRRGEDASERGVIAAPFTDKPCLAFRVEGERGAQPLDDADAVSFAVVTDDGRRLAVHAADVVVLLPARGPVYREGAERFLEERGLQKGAISARESRLAPKDRVRVQGHLASLAIAGAGYRGHQRLEVLDAGDNQPVLIDAAANG
ncbi:hypothetical protein [Polyangium aurulentum]|uniref:hypothetical protein n=1 Tax=Polyangium aurulentum TaxID=2567896 RepID=UPI0010ADD6BE|nr:hypothetical protein [Polyangium aurulentum]UQA59510.1 hypothetical protein E8A73_003075 [Polyangium aurulentum]